VVAQPQQQQLQYQQVTLLRLQELQLQLQVSQPPQQLLQSLQMAARQWYLHRLRRQQVLPLWLLPPLILDNLPQPQLLPRQQLLPEQPLQRSQQPLPRGQKARQLQLQLQLQQLRERVLRDFNT
jgi:hypothetical protein